MYFQTNKEYHRTFRLTISSWTDIKRHTILTGFGGIMRYRILDVCISESFNIRTRYSAYPCPESNRTKSAAAFTIHSTILRDT